MSKCDSLTDYKILTKINQDDWNEIKSDPLSLFFVNGEVLKVSKTQYVVRHMLSNPLYQEFTLNNSISRINIKNEWKDGFVKQFYCQMCSMGNESDYIHLPALKFSDVNFISLKNMNKCYKDDIITIQVNGEKMFLGASVISTRSHVGNEYLFYNLPLLQRLVKIAKYNPEISCVGSGLSGSVNEHFHVHTADFKYAVQLDNKNKDMKNIGENVYYAIVKKGSSRHVVIKSLTDEKSISLFYELVNKIYSAYKSYQQHNEIQLRFSYTMEGPYFVIIIAFTKKHNELIKQKDMEIWYDSSLMTVRLNMIPIEMKRDEIDELINEAIKSYLNFDFIDYIDNIPDILELKPYIDPKIYIYNIDRPLLKLNNQYKYNLVYLFFDKGIDWIRANMKKLLLFDALHTQYEYKLEYVKGVPSSYDNLILFTKSFGDNIDYILHIFNSNIFYGPNTLRSYKNINFELRNRLEINTLRKYIPHFEFTHFTFKNFTVVETIDKHAIMDEPYSEIIMVIIQVLISIYVGQKVLGLYHGNLNLNNIYLVPLVNKCMDWTYNLDKNTYKIKLNKYVYITNFKRAKLHNTNKYDDVDTFLRSLPHQYDIQHIIYYWNVIKTQPIKINPLLELIDYVYLHTSEPTYQYVWNDSSKGSLQKSHLTHLRNIANIRNL